MWRPGLVLAGAAALALPFIAHSLTVSEGARPFAEALGWLLAVATAVAFARGVRFVEAAAVVAAVVAAWYASHGTQAAVVLPSVAFNLLLLWFFGRTLVDDRVPLVTAIARFVHGTLKPELERYARNVTWMWCGFFAAMAAASCLLAAFAPLAVWSFFANVLVYPLVAVTFLAEYAHRRRRFPEHDHVPPFALLRRLVKAGYFGSAPSPK